jgi:hypothetical protein
MDIYTYICFSDFYIPNLNLKFGGKMDYRGWLESQAASTNKSLEASRVIHP